VTQGGAEAEYYASLQPPREARNGHALTVRELLMVRGMTRQSLLGDDWHYTGLLEDTTASAGLTAVSDTGWGALLTVSSRVNNVSAGGQERINIQSADESELTGVSGITREIAQAIIAYRNQNRLESIGHLLDVTASRGDGTSLNSGLQGGPSSVPGGSSGGPRVIDESLLLDIADELTAQDETQLSGVINVNTATAEVLMCLPGVTRELAHAIVSYRQSSGFLPNIAYLLRVPGMTRDIFKQLAPRVTARSETFRILSEGTVTSTGVRRRIEVIVHIGLNDTQTLGYREGDL
jgi:competence ComEA-like helix-hairpin-helix protein